MAELNRRLGAMIMLGTVHEADYAAARVRVWIGRRDKSEGFPTGWLPWIVSRAGGDTTWRALEEGEQVVVLSPSGEPTQGVVLGSVYQASNPANGDDPDIDRMDYGNGSYIQHDRNTGKLTINVTGDIDIIAGGNVRVQGKRIDLN